MARDEVEDTLYGEMLDLMDCLAIYNGGAEEKKQKRRYEELVRLK